MGSLLLVAVLLPVYWLTAVFGAEINVDAEAAALPAWNLAVRGELDLRDVDTANPWLVEGDDRVASNRPPGLWLLAVPFYLVAGGDEFRPGPSTAAAVVLTLAALVVVHLLLRTLVPGRWALGATFVLALGTATWPISSAQLWPHGPAQLLLAVGLLAALHRRAVIEGAAATWLILLRPVLAVVPAALLALRARRRAAGTVPLAIALAVGLTTIVLYNAWMFGEPSLSGGYQDTFRENLRGQHPVAYVGNLLAFFVGPDNGALVWSPVLVVGIAAAVATWRELPAWTRDAALAGLAYLVVHARLNRASGGLPFDYRYPIEAITLATPALVLAVHRSGYVARTVPRIVLGLAIAAGVVLQGMVAVTSECEPDPDDPSVAICTLV